MQSFWNNFEVMFLFKSNMKPGWSCKLIKAALGIKDISEMQIPQQESYRNVHLVNYLKGCAVSECLTIKSSTDEGLFAHCPTPHLHAFFFFPAWTFILYSTLSPSLLVGLWDWSIFNILGEGVRRNQDGSDTQEIFLHMLASFSHPRLPSSLVSSLVSSHSSISSLSSLSQLFPVTLITTVSSCWTKETILIVPLIEKRAEVNL